LPKALDFNTTGALPLKPHLLFCLNTKK